MGFVSFFSDRSIKTEKRYYLWNILDEEAKRSSIGITIFVYEKSDGKRLRMIYEEVTFRIYRVTNDLGSSNLYVAARLV